MVTHRARACVHSLTFERIMSKFAGNILRLTITGKDYVLFIVTHRVYACKDAPASACVITHSLIYGRILFKFAVNYNSTCYKSHQVARARAWFNSQLSLDGFSSNLMGTYYKWPQVTWDTYVSCSNTACVCERACASASVIKRSLIFERILFRFGGDKRQIPIGYMRYLICVWMHVLTARTC
jgi:hypothetical protein